MGLPKAALPFGPELMLQRVVRLVGQAVDRVVVVAAPGQSLPELPENVATLRDRSEGRGPLEGLAVGLAALADSAEAVYATSCDVPLLVPAFVERMFTLLGEHDVAVPKDEKYHHPLAGVYRPRILTHVERLLSENRLRPFFLFAECNTREVPVAELRAVDSELATLDNLNGPQEYFAALRRVGFRAPDHVAAVLNRSCSKTSRKTGGM